MTDVLPVPLAADAERRDDPDAGDDDIYGHVLATSGAGRPLVGPHRLQLEGCRDTYGFS